MYVLDVWFLQIENKLCVSKQEWITTAIKTLNAVNMTIIFMFTILSSMVEVKGGDGDTFAVLILSLVILTRPPISLPHCSPP